MGKSRFKVGQKIYYHDCGRLVEDRVKKIVKNLSSEGARSFVYMTEKKQNITNGLFRNIAEAIKYSID